MTKNAVLCLLAAALLIGLAALAQDAEAPRAPTQDGDREQPQQGASAETEEPVSDDVFVPSEEVQAAEELAFPVNI